VHPYNQLDTDFIVESAEVNATSCSIAVSLIFPKAGGGFRSCRKSVHGRKVLAICATSLAWAAAASAEERAIDTGKSVMTVRVYKAGLLSSVAGHDHEITAPIAGGTVDIKAHQVELRMKTGALQVRDREGSEKDRAEIQSTMLGPEVLEAERHPEIVFRATGAEPMGADSWRVNGNLSLHGQTRAVAVEVRETDGHYLGTSRFKQTDFGIKPVKVAGGTIRVKDEVRVEFDIQLTR
jgi:polyisoprenoid-binding protein YceI